MRKTTRLRLFTILLLTVTILSAIPHSVSAIGEIAGQVLATDITAYINGYPIPTYNIGGKLSVIVTDLRRYGFTTVYNDATRTSSVSLQVNSGTTITPLPLAAPSGAAVGSVVMNVYNTDITVKVNGKTVPGFNVGGKMAMYFSDLAPFGTCAFDNDSRVSTLTVDSLPFNDKSLPSAQYEVPTTGDYKYRYLDNADAGVYRDYSLTQGGSFSYHLVNPTPGVSQLVYAYTLRPNTSYRVRAAIRTADCGDSYGACLTTQNGSLSNAQSSATVTGTSDWTTVDCLAFTETDGVLLVGYCLGNGGDTAKGEAWFSGLSLEEFHPYSESDFHFNVSDYGKADTVSLSNNPDNNLRFTISGDRLRVEGKIVYEGLTELWLICGDDEENQKFLSVSSGEAFSAELVIPVFTDKKEVLLFTKRPVDSMYLSYVWKQLFLEKSGSGYRFAYTPVLQNNLEYQKLWIDPVQYLNYDIPAEIRTLSDKIVGSETDDYKKLLAIHRWVAQNISYDNDGLNGKSAVVYSALEVLHAKKSVCAGYANLAQALIQAQGIPCMQTSTYSTPDAPFTENNIEAMETNHTHIEAYVNNRWVTMDPTWDSSNSFENGMFRIGTCTLYYFDITPEFLSFSHKILCRG